MRCCTASRRALGAGIHSGCSTDATISFLVDQRWRHSQKKSCCERNENALIAIQAVDLPGNRKRATEMREIKTRLGGLCHCSAAHASKGYPEGFTILLRDSYVADGAWQRRESYGLCRCDCEHGGDAHPRQPNCFFVSAERFVGTGVRGQEPLRGHAATASCAPGLQKREDAQISPAMVIPRPPWRLASPWCVGFAARIVMSDTNNSRQLCEKPADPQQVAEIATSCARIRGSGWLRCSRDLRGSALRF